MLAFQVRLKTPKPQPEENHISRDSTSNKYVNSSLPFGAICAITDVT